MENPNPLDTNKCSVPVLDSNITYDYFFNNFMLPNVPCVIRNLTQNWESAKYWSLNNKPNFEYLTNKYGDCEVTIYRCSEKYYNSQKTFPSSLKEYIEYWKNFKYNDTLNYLKDWHLKLKYPEDNFYSVPQFFSSDWLNEYFLECQEDDYRFVYMGPKNTWTPFHADVFNSYSWSVNICGKKRWLFFAPEQVDNLKDGLNNLPYDVTEVKSKGNCLEVIQNAGEAIFVPSCWYHQVYNLEDTISINHNWVNGCNIMYMWEALQKHLASVIKEIDDCKDMDDFAGHCQIMLNASFGFDYFKFYDLLRHIGLKRIRQLKNAEKYVIFDLQSVQKILESFNDSKVILDLSYFTTVEPSPDNLLKQIVDVLENNKCAYRK